MHRDGEGVTRSTRSVEVLKRIEGGLVRAARGDVAGGASDQQRIAVRSEPRPRLHQQRAGAADVLDHDGAEIWLDALGPGRPMASNAPAGGNGKISRTGRSG